LFAGVMATPGLSPIGGGASVVHGEEEDLEGSDFDREEGTNSNNERDEDLNQTVGANATRNLSLVLEEEAEREKSGTSSTSGGLGGGSGDMSMVVAEHAEHAEQPIDRSRGDEDVMGSSREELSLSGNDSGVSRMQMKLSRMTREMEEDDEMEEGVSLESVDDQDQTLASGEESLRMFSPLKTPAKAVVAEESGGGRTPGIDFGVMVEQVRKNSSNNHRLHSGVNDERDPLRMSELKKETLKRGGLLSHGKEEYSHKKTSMAPATTARNPATSATNNNTTTAATSTTSTTSTTHKNLSASFIHPLSASTMFSASTLSASRNPHSNPNRTQHEPNIGAALWEAKKMGITSIATQMEYAHTIAYGRVKTYRSGATYINNHHTTNTNTATAGNAAHSSPPLETGTFSSSSSMGSSTNQNWPAGSTLYGTNGGSSELPHWYVHPGATRTSPTSDRVLDFTAMRMDSTVQKFSSGYWANKMGLGGGSRSGGRGRRSGASALNTSVSALPEQTYRYRSPIASY
jgi:hypothetical protein